MNNQDEDQQQACDMVKEVGARLLAELELARSNEGSPFATLKSRFARVREEEFSLAKDDFNAPMVTNTEVANLPEKRKHSKKEPAIVTVKRLTWNLPPDDSTEE